MDWRHRKNEWKGTAHLAAREYKWLSPDFGELDAPTTIQSSMTLFLALTASMYTIDVSDEYIPSGATEKEDFSLPGQRAGAQGIGYKVLG